MKKTCHKPSSLVGLRATGKPPESFTYLKYSSLKEKFTFRLDFTYIIIRAIFDRGQCLREWSWTRLVTASRCGVIKGLVRSFEIIDVTPMIEYLLTVINVVK
jgi:hypothetical protein